jgi:hypothetical protein
MFFAFACMLLMPFKAQARYRYTKIQPGMAFVHFDIEDIYRQRWVSNYLRGKPIIILTGHRYQRYEILKWAETLRQEFGLPGHVHLLWVVNLRKFPWSTSRGTVRKQWRDFNPPIPLLLDWDGIIGKSLKVNYNIPNIIVIDAYGRLAMHEMHTYNPHVYSAISAHIKSLLNVNPGIAAQPSVPLPVNIAPAPVGQRGDSN